MTAAEAKRDFLLVGGFVRKSGEKLKKSGAASDDVTGTGPWHRHSGIATIPEPEVDQNQP